MSRRITCFWVERDGPVWVRRDTGETLPHPTQFGPGALYDAGWAREGDLLPMYRRYPDGFLLTVVTPDGPWVIDGPAYNKERGHYPCPWTRTGDPRVPSTLSVTPSIKMGDPETYHAVLTNGVLDG